jgi:iron complex outermembrane receptor protein
MLALLMSTAMAAAGTAAPAWATGSGGGAAGAPQVVADERARDFDIPAQALADALNAFGRQAGLQVSAATSVTSGVRSQAVVGRLTPDEALTRLLAGSGLSWRYTDAGTVVLQPEDRGDAVTLDEIRVDASGETATGPVDGFVARRSATATKTDTPLIETPRSVSVISADEMEARGSQSVVDAVRYSAGVGTGAYGFDPRFDQITVRGFSTTTIGDYRDGLRQPYTAYGTFRTEPYNLERLEVLKGPASTLYGQSSAGGLTNRVSKRPTANARGEARLRFASEDRKEGALDLSGPLGEEGELLYRIVGLAREGRSDLEVEDDRMMFAPSLTWQPSEDTSLTLLALIQEDETDSNVAALNRNGEVYEIRASDPDYDYQKVTEYQLGYEFDHRFDETFSFAQNLRYSGFGLDARYLTGSAAGGGWSGDTYRRGAQAVEEDMDAVQVDNRLGIDFGLGPVGQEVLLGVDYQWFQSQYGIGSSAADPDFALDFNDPGYGVEGPTPELTTRTTYETRQVGLYLRDEMTYEDWHLSFGLRHDWLDRTTTDRNTGAETAKADETALTGDVGLLYAFDVGISPYASYGTAFEPTSNRDAQGQVLDPIEAEQFEVGIKFQPRDWNAFFAISAYHMTQQNVPKYAGYSPTAGSYYEAVGEITTKGIEIEGRASLAAGLDLTVAYAFSDAEITEDRTASNVGNEPAVTPRHSGSVWLGYAFQDGPLDGLGLGGGVRLVGETYTSNANTDTNDAYALFDASIDYELGAIAPLLEGASLGVNGTNLADKRAEVCNGGYCYLGEGRTVLGELKYRW